MSLINPKQVGEVSEANIIAALMNKGYSISKPIGDNQRYDLIIDIESKLYRIQCKTGRKEGNRITFPVCSVRVNKSGYKIQNYDGQIEFFAVWCKELSKAYLIPKDKINVKREASIYLDSNRLNCIKAVDYILS